MSRHDVKLKKYDNSNLMKIQNLGSGSYGTVQLLFHKELNKLVVGKYFSSGGDQCTIDKVLTNAEREAQILARMKHENIVNIIGTTSRDNSFGIILEFVCCGNMENLLLDGTEIPIPWKIRVRYPKKSFIHGDLKPQNILLTDRLQIKLADFGATAIAKLTGATSMTISGEGNTQHTPFYTAPEYLRKPTKEKCCSMDVYSYGMIGYEILTRKRVFDGSQVPLDVLMYLIKNEGRKPDESCLNKVSKTLKKTKNEHKIFSKLKTIVQQCWKTDAQKRPKISNVKKDLENFSTMENVCKIDQAVKALVEERKLKKEIPKSKQSSLLFKLKLFKDDVEKISNTWQARVFSTIFIILVLVFILSYRQSGAVFLLSDGAHLVRYDIASFNHTYLPKFPLAHQEDTTVQNLVKVNDMVYVISCIEFRRAIRINLSDPSATWESIAWKDKYKNRKHIAFKDSIFAIGTQSDYMNDDCQHTLTKSSEAYMFNTLKNTWIQLPSMSEARLGPALVIFDGLVCAVGGSASRSVECFNQTRNQWISLPLMNSTRRDAAAVELKGELYVIGGTLSFDLPADEIRSYYSRYALSSVEKYNPITNKWTTVTKLHEGRIYHGAGVANGEIYVVGGFSSVVEVYNPESDAWRIADTVFNAQRYHRFIAIDVKSKDEDMETPTKQYIDHITNFALGHWQNVRKTFLELTNILEKLLNLSISSES